MSNNSIPYQETLEVKDETLFEDLTEALSAIPEEEQINPHQPSPLQSTIVIGDRSSTSSSASPTSVITANPNDPNHRAGLTSPPLNDSAIVIPHPVIQSPHIFSGSAKRRRTEDYDEGLQPGAMACQAKSHRLNSLDQSRPPIYPHFVPVTPQPQSHFFIHVRHSPWIYQTEDWKPKGCTMYTPLPEDIMINTLSVEQISFETDQFFLADDRGNYMGAKPGSAIHLWKFDKNDKKLYISRSILFLKEQDFIEIRHQLQQL